MILACMALSVFIWLHATTLVDSASTLDLYFINLPVNEDQFLALSSDLKTFEQQEIVKDLTRYIIDQCAYFNISVFAVLTEINDSLYKPILKRQ